jgi:hypothetical protein
MDNRRVYFEASPVNYVIRANNQVSFFLTWGTGNDIVSPSQSEDFLLALRASNKTSEIGDSDTDRPMDEKRQRPRSADR